MRVRTYLRCTFKIFCFLSIYHNNDNQDDRRACTITPRSQTFLKQETPRLPVFLFRVLWSAGRSSIDINGLEFKHCTAVASLKISIILPSYFPCEKGKSGMLGKLYPISPVLSTFGIKRFRFQFSVFGRHTL